VSPEGVITAFGLAEANSDERLIGEFLISSDEHDAFLTDKGFSSAKWERYCLETYGALVAATPQESARRAWPEKARRWAAGKRYLIESVIDQLKDLFALERHQAKTLQGLLARLAAKLPLTPVGRRSTPDSVGRCAIRPNSWFEELLSKRLRCDKVVSVCVKIVGCF
jgi:hypothetical protein